MVETLVAACLEAFGRIDVLHNNVGGSAPGGPVEMSEAVWDQQMEHNLKHVFLACKLVLPVMQRVRKGSIVNVASTSTSSLPSATRASPWAHGLGLGRGPCGTFPRLGQGQVRHRDRDHRSMAG